MGIGKTGIGFDKIVAFLNKTHISIGNNGYFLLLLRYFYHKGHKVLNKETQGAVYFLDTYLPIILKEFLVFLVFSWLPLW